MVQYVGMEINISKTAFISLTKKKRPLSFTYNLKGLNITQVDKVKYLGVTFSQDLKWDKHITDTCAKAFKQLGFLRRRLSKAPQAVKLTAYKTLVRPILEYGSIVWDPHQKYLRDKLERLQNRALRFIYSKYSWHDSVTDMRNQAHLATLSCRRHVASMKFFISSLTDTSKSEKTTIFIRLAVGLVGQTTISASGHLIRIAIRLSFPTSLAL